jgi:hypothetical protein
VRIYRIGEKESIEAILEATRLKTEGKAKRVIVAGCLVERYRDDLRKELPEVDAFIGTSQINDILKVTDENVDPRSLPVFPIGNKTSTYLYDEYTPRLRATESHTAFYKDSGRLRPALRVLLDTVNARLVSLAAFWIDNRRSTKSRKGRRQRGRPDCPGFLALWRRPGRS